MKTPIITSNPDICHGSPVIAGTRIMVWQILELLEGGLTEKEIYQSYPTLPKGSIEATLHFAAQSIKSDYYDSTKKGGRTQIFA